MESILSLIGRGCVASASCIIASFMLIEGGGALFGFMNEQGLWQSRADGTCPTVMSHHGDDEEKGGREKEQLDENFPFIALYLSPSLPSSLSNVLLLAFRCSASPALSSCDGIVLHADESSTPPVFVHPSPEPLLWLVVLHPTHAVPSPPRLLRTSAPTAKIPNFTPLLWLAGKVDELALFMCVSASLCECPS